MKIYLSGPMRGLPNLGFEEFHRVAKLLRADDHEVLSPAEMDEEAGFDPADGEEDFDLKAAIFRDLEAIGTVDAIVMLPGWEKSQGVRAERALAEFLDLKVYEWIENESGAHLVPVERKHTVLDEAKELVHGNRGRDYGHPFDDFSRTAGALRSLFGWPVKPEHIPIIMIVVKLSREVNRPKHDNRVDGPGYFETLDMVHQRYEELREREDG